MLAGTAEFSRVIREYLLEMTFPQSLGGDGGKGLLGRGLCEGLRWEQACLLWPREQGAVRVGCEGWRGQQAESQGGEEATGRGKAVGSGGICLRLSDGSCGNL